MRLAALVLGVAAMVTVGCSDDPGSSELPEVPAGAISLTQNQPTRFEGLVVVASAIDASGADLSGSDGTSVAVGGWTDVGGTVEIQGRTLRLVATWTDPDPGESPGSDTSKAWVVVEQ